MEALSEISFCLYQWNWFSFLLSLWPAALFQEPSLVKARLQCEFDRCCIHLLRPDSATVGPHKQAAPFFVKDFAQRTL